MRRLLCALLLLRSACAGANVVRIPLLSTDHLRFVGAIRTGLSDEYLRVVFDTGSSDMWISTAGLEVTYQEHDADSSFLLRYGTGTVAGWSAPVDLQLGGDNEAVLLVHDVHVGFVASLPTEMEELGIQGVVGLGMESLAQIHRNCSLWSHFSRQQPAMFSLYISSFSGAQPSSHLLLGNTDPTLLDPDAKWFSFAVVPRHQPHASQFSPPGTRESFGFGFWSIRLKGFAVDNTVESLDGIALLDSGTSFVLLPPHAFNAVAQALVARFISRLIASTGARDSLLACRSCHAREFPSLAFDFLSGPADTSFQRFVLLGSDYVRCDRRRRECTAMLDVVNPTEVGSDAPVVVLGTVFLRAFYSRYDYTRKQVALACSTSEHGVCLGGRTPVLDYTGDLYDAPRENHVLTGVGAAVTALALLCGLRVFW